MIDSYEEGQKLTADDFRDGYFLPIGKWQYCIVENIDKEDGIVTLHYYGAEEEDTKDFSMEEIADMLGWKLDKDTNRFDVDSSDSIEQESTFFYARLWQNQTNRS